MWVNISYCDMFFLHIGLLMGNSRTEINCATLRTFKQIWQSRDQKNGIPRYTLSDDCIKWNICLSGEKMKKKKNVSSLRLFSYNTQTFPMYVLTYNTAHRNTILSSLSQKKCFLSTLLPMRFHKFKNFYMPKVQNMVMVEGFLWIWQF